MAKPNGNGKRAGWRDQKEPRQMMQKKDNAPNNQLKKNQNMEDKKKRSLQPRKLSPEKCFQRNKKQ
jgi:hypothetical protein